MGLFDELLGAAQDLREAFAEPLNEIKDSFTEGLSGASDIKTGAEETVQSVKDSISNITGK